MIIDSATKREIKDLIKSRLMQPQKKALVFSAAPLDEEDKILLMRVLRFLKRDNFAVIYSLDESLLAGVVVKIGSKVIDLSLKGKLTNLRQTMYEIS